MLNNALIKIMVVLCENSQLHRCFLQVKENTERLKSCEQELQVNLSTLCFSWFLTVMEPGLLDDFGIRCMLLHDVHNVVKFAAWNALELNLICDNSCNCGNLVFPFFSIICIIGPFGSLNCSQDRSFYFVTSLLQSHIISYFYTHFNL